jgi:multisubunit Na+/H+ antiporter MnhC subunit
MASMGSLRIKQQVIFILVLIVAVPFAAQIRAINVERLQPTAYSNSIQANVQPTPDDSNRQLVEPTQKRNSDPLRYAVVFTAIVFVSLVLLFIYLTRRKRRSQE